MTAYSLSVNGREHRVEAAPDTPLLWVLRDNLGFTGTKFGCGIGSCGACTVHIAGAPVRSCRVSVASVAHRPITTIESLAGSPHGSRLQTAWIEEQVPQCGYCQAGQLMAAAALLAQSKRP